MPIFMVEREFSPPLTEAQFMAGGQALAPCLQERDIKHVASYFSPDGSRSVCVFEGSDAERVREAQRTAGVPFKHVWQAAKFGG